MMKRAKLNENGRPGGFAEITNQEFERRMGFILEQQAHFISDIQQLREGLDQLRESQAQTDQVVGRLAAVTLEGFKGVNAKIDALVDSHIRLTKRQAHTDETLRNLIAVIDRYFSNGRN